LVLKNVALEWVKRKFGIPISFGQPKAKFKDLLPSLGPKPMVQAKNC